MVKASGDKGDDEMIAAEKVLLLAEAEQIKKGMSQSERDAFDLGAIWAQEAFSRLIDSHVVGNRENLREYTVTYWQIMMQLL